MKNTGRQHAKRLRKIESQKKRGVYKGKKKI